MTEAARETPFASNIHLWKNGINSDEPAWRTWRPNAVTNGTLLARQPKLQLAKREIRARGKWVAF